MNKGKELEEIGKKPLQIFVSEELGTFTIGGVTEKTKVIIKAKTIIKGNKLVDIKTCPGESCSGNCGCDQDCWHY